MTERVMVGDQELIAAAQENSGRGSERAFGELVCRYRDGVVGVVYRMCGDMPLAEEAAQEAFLRVWQHLPGYRAEHSFRAWVYRIAINAALDALRREKPTSDIDAVAEEGLASETITEGPERALESKQRAERVRRAILGLPEASRAVLVMREYGGLSYAEIAAGLGIPLGTVMSRLNSARGQLRQSLAGIMEVL